MTEALHRHRTGIAQKGVCNAAGTTSGIAQLHEQSRLHGDCTRNGALECHAGRVSEMRRREAPLMVRQSSLFARPAEAPASAPFHTRKARTVAYAQWLADGQPWPPPAGLLSATINRLMRRTTR